MRISAAAIQYHERLDSNNTTSLHNLVHNLCRLGLGNKAMLTARLCKLWGISYASDNEGTDAIGADDNWSLVEEVVSSAKPIDGTRFSQITRILRNVNLELCCVTSLSGPKVAAFAGLPDCCATLIQNISDELNWPSTHSVLNGFAIPHLPLVTTLRIGIYPDNPESSSCDLVAMYSNAVQRIAHTAEEMSSVMAHETSGSPYIPGCLSFGDGEQICFPMTSDWNAHIEYSPLPFALVMYTAAAAPDSERRMRHTANMLAYMFHSYAKIRQTLPLVGNKNEQSSQLTIVQNEASTLAGIESQLASMYANLKSMNEKMRENARLRHRCEANSQNISSVVNEILRATSNNHAGYALREYNYSAESLTLPTVLRASRYEQAHKMQLDQIDAATPGLALHAAQYERGIEGYLLLLAIIAVPGSVAEVFGFFDLSQRDGLYVIVVSVLLMILLAIAGTQQVYAWLFAPLRKILNTPIRRSRSGHTVKKDQ
jgi:hypothetical protein